MKIMKKNFGTLFNVLDSDEAKKFTEEFSKTYRKYSLLRLEESIKDEENETDDASTEYIEKLKTNQKFIETFNFTPIQVFFLTFYNFIYYDDNAKDNWINETVYINEPWIELFNHEDFILKALQENILELKDKSVQDLDGLIVASEDDTFDNVTVILKNIFESPKNEVVNNYSLTEFIEYVKILQQFSDLSVDEFNGIVYLISRILALNVKPENLLKQLDKNVDNTFGDVLEVYLAAVKISKKCSENNEKFENDFDKAINKLFSISFEAIKQRVNNSAVSQEYTVDYIAMTKEFEEAFPNGLKLLSRMIQEIGKVIIEKRLNGENSDSCIFVGEPKPLDYKYFIKNYNDTTPVKWLVKLTHH